MKSWLARILIRRSLIRAQVEEPDKAALRPLLGVAFLRLRGLYRPFMGSALGAGGHCTGSG